MCIRCAYDVVNRVVWCGVGGVGDRSTGCHRAFSDPGSEGF